MILLYFLVYCVAVYLFVGAKEPTLGILFCIYAESLRFRRPVISYDADTINVIKVEEKDDEHASIKPEKYTPHH